MNEEDKLAKIIWNYMLMGHELEKSDAIVVFGSNDVRVGEFAAELFLQGWAPLLVFSGAKGRLTEDWGASEAEVFSRAAQKMGVPKSSILVETKSTNSVENVVYTKQLLERENITAQKIILVQKPYMERRAYATLTKQWPDVEAVVTSPPIPYETYQDRHSEMIDRIVGDLQRICIYGEKGDMVSQKIPDEVMQAYKQLINLGYTRHIIK